jgi:hypothetical protein
MSGMTEEQMDFRYKMSRMTAGERMTHEKKE